jgi:PAS domain S-box-containing protein
MSDGASELRRLRLANEALRQRVAELENEARQFKDVSPRRDRRGQSLAGGTAPQRTGHRRVLGPEPQYPPGQCVLEENVTKREQVLSNTIIDSIPGTFYLLDENGYYVRGNNFQREVIVGKPEDQFTSTNALETIHPEDRALIQARIASVLRDANEEAVEGRVLLRGGPDFVWMLMTGRRMTIGGKPFLVGIGIDITERKRLEAEREELEAQLRMSQKMEAIGSLAGGVAHDFNNLVSVILSYTGFAMNAVPEGDPIQEDLAEVRKAGERAAALTRQLLAFGRKQVLQPVPLDINQTAMGVEKMLQRILGEDIDLVQKLAPDLGVTLADQGQIEQLIMNLVVNARDAMPDGGKLTIETSNVEVDEEYAARHLAVKPGSYVQLAVTDTGCGMDEQTRARIFDPFFTTKEKGKGTGLGLSTVYGIVKQSGGDIWVYSELGQGTTFKIYLPRELSVAKATVVTPPAVPMLSKGTETILVVEDEEALRKIAQRILGLAGYKVLTAANGHDALLVSAEHAGEVQLLLTDVVMPRMSGRVLAEELVKTQPNLKVLYMSGYTDDAIVHHGVLEAGIHFLPKPFTSADLMRKVREVLDKDTDCVEKDGDSNPCKA